MENGLGHRLLERERQLRGRGEVDPVVVRELRARELAPPAGQLAGNRGPGGVEGGRLLGRTDRVVAVGQIGVSLVLIVGFIEISNITCLK